MPELTRTQQISYPGIVNGVNSFTYWCSHGISPGKAVIVTNPQKTRPAESGDITIGDGVEKFKLTDCRVDELLETWSAEGIIWTLTLSDRRWRWKTGYIDGKYNQQDKQNKLVPWTIRSLKELAELCLAKMGEKNYQIDLPPGLDRKKGEKIDEYLKLGANFPQTGTNPPIDWGSRPVPAVALNDFVERFGCRIVFQPIKNRVCIVPYGGPYQVNSSLPVLSVSSGIKNPKVPQGVGVWGAETAHQCRIVLEPVALDYGSVYVPLDEASYAPPKRNDRLTVTITATAPAGKNHKISIASPRFGPGTNVVVTGTTLSNLASVINAQVSLSKILFASVAGAVLTLTQKVDKKGIGFEFSINEFVYTGTVPTDHPEGAEGLLSTPFYAKSSRWAANLPPLFPLCEATDRLSKNEAIALAQMSVWKAFRVKLQDLSGVPLTRGAAVVPPQMSGPKRGVKPKSPGAAPPPPKLYFGRGVEIPGYGVVKRRQNIILSGRMVEQITPQPRDLKGGDRPAAYGGGIMPDFYSGYARDADARCYGTYAAQVGSVCYLPQTKNDPNTPPLSRVRVPFQILADQQIVLFSDYVYRYSPQGGDSCYVDPCIVYEGAVYVADFETNDIERYVKTMKIPGGDGAIEYTVKDDVIVNWIGDYANADDSVKKANGYLDGSVIAPSGGYTEGKTPEQVASDVFCVLKKDREEDFGDGKRRADYYLRGMLKQYQAPQSQFLPICGIRVIDPDNAVHQVVWKLGPEGPTTSVSVNSETSYIVPQYPQRRLAENLPPNIQAKLLNLSENYGPGGAGVLAKAQTIGSVILGPAGRLLGG